MEDRFAKMVLKIRDAFKKDYDCEEPYAKKIVPAVNKAFVNFFKDELKDFGDEYEFVNISKNGHEHVSLFLQDKNKFNPDGKTKPSVYISLEYIGFEGILRLLKEQDSVLYRTANHEKDYTGGCNEYASLTEVVEEAVNLLRGIRKEGNRYGK